MSEELTKAEERELTALWYLRQAHIAEFLGGKASVPKWVRDWQRDNEESPYAFWLGADA